MTSPDVITAFNRFGLGARPGDLDKLTGDPKQALLAEIADPTTLFLADSGLPDTIDAYAQVRQYQRARQTQRQMADAAVASTPDEPAMAGDAKPDATKSVAAALAGLPSPQSLFAAEVAGRVDAALAAPIGFGERLVAFWANHFAVQATSSEVVRGLAGAFEREAIRPYVLGSFGDMALAATQHPAMLVSLNNVTSVGPDSPLGKKRGLGLNENHARELMELHTVGVGAGYTQADVTSFARVLTGWTFGQGEKQPAVYGRFLFRKQAHEPGPQTVMGRVYPQPGVDQGEAVIAALVASPATAQHIALQFARYFVADNPAQALVDRLAATFTKTRGDLAALATTLVNSPEAWSAPPQKLRTPQEYVLASARALSFTPKPQLVSRTLDDLGEPYWSPASPQGFKDDAATWLAPGALTTRLDVAELFAAQSKGPDDPRDLATAILGPALSSETAEAVARAESRTQGVALLLMSPEFQRR